jgi:hypothetical protein
MARDGDGVSVLLGVVILAIIVVTPLILCLETGLLQVVAEAFFATQLPFWPTCAAVVLKWIWVGSLRSVFHK